MKAIMIGLRLAIERYPGYRFLRLWRDGRGAETVIAACLVQIAAWLVGCDNVKVTIVEEKKLLLFEEVQDES